MPAAQPPTVPVLTTPNPHYERLGGAPAVQALVAAFYRAMDSRPDAALVRAMHASDLEATQALLVRYLSEWLGGPRLYSPERGAPMLRRRHQPFDIDNAAVAAWMTCMRQALAETCADTALRAELDAAFNKVALAVRNTEGPVAADAPSTSPTSPSPKSLHPHRSAP